MSRRSWPGFAGEADELTAFVLDLDLAGLPGGELFDLGAFRKAQSDR